MAYRDDITNLGADHLYVLETNPNDSIGSANGTNVGVVYTGTTICEDTSNSMVTNGTTDSVDLPSTGTINNNAHQRKAVAGWFMTDSIQAPPFFISGDGGSTSSFKIVAAFGNNCMCEASLDGSFNVQVYGIPLQPNRAYHLCGVFEGNSFDNTLKFYIDGVEQTLSDPVDAAIDASALGALRSVHTFGSPVTNPPDIGGDPVTVVAPTNGHYSMWAFWADSADTQLTQTEIREELFEKGALPHATISAGTQTAMQTALDALASTVRPDVPLCIRVETVTGDGDLTLDADDITFNELASIHVQYMGTGTLTWRNLNGSDASIGSTPNGGTITFAQAQTLTVTVTDASNGSAIENARVYITAASGGPLVEGTVIMNTLTNSSGVATVAFDYTSDQPFTGRVRKGSSSPYYKTGALGGTLTSTALNTSSLLVGDQ